MSTREQLNNYLRGLESRLRLLVVSRGVAVAFGVALGATLALVLVTNAFAFSENSMLVARIALYISLAAAIGIGLVIPLLKLNQRNAAGKAEQANPEFNQRLVTYIERREARDPMLELLAEDTLDRARKSPPTEVVPQKSIFAFSAGAGAALVVLMWLILAGPGFLGFGAKTLWAGLPKDSSGLTGGKYYEIVVEPGDETVRRRTDVSIVATLKNFMAPEVRLMARYENSAKWEEALMLPRVGEASYGFLLAAVPEGLEYYVEANGVRSKTYRIQVVDLPGISNIKVTYHYPARLGQKDYVEDPGGDLRAVVGTVAELLVETDKPLTNGVIVMQDGTEIALKPTTGNFLTANVKIEKEGTYHFAAVNGSERVRLTQDYFIEAQGDEGPKIRITHPGLDHRANPIEEVVITAEATDDFGVNSMDLHYSVNGGAEKVVSLIGNQRGSLIADGKITLYLEDFKMVPGDVVSFYVTAKDAAVESASDIGFIEAQPFEKNYSQSQAGGGGGGGGGAQQEQNEISRRQREIIQLTHNALRGSAEDKAAATKERAAFLAEVQGKLRDQANSLANRVKARELDDESGSIKEFVKEIEAAAAEMGPAAEQLSEASWEAALVPEQKALQHLQRAEQMNRDIQVAFGNQGGGGGGGGNAGRDLANLFDLELDTEKNQYEQAEQAGSPAEQQQQQIDEALQKLQELARRQEQLAQQQRSGKQTLDKRWEQEQLRREAEQLRRELERMQQQQASNSQRSSSQMSRGQQGQQGQQGQSGQSGQQGQQGQSGQSGQQSASQRQVQRLLDQIKQAEEQMREAQRANQTGNQSEADAAARRAAAQLQQAQDAARQMQREGTQAGLQGLSQRADSLANRQKQVEERLRAAAQGGNNRSPQGNMTRAEAEELARQKEEMAKELAALERDVQRQARDLAQSQPEASRRLRDGLSETQQAEARRRLEVGAEYVRDGQGAAWYRSGYETPVTRSTQELAEAIRQAQGQLQEAGGQQGNENSQLARQVQDVQRLREQLERLREQARQQGQQGKGGQQGQQGQNGQQGQQGQQGQNGQQGQQGQNGQQGQQGQGGQQGGQQPGGQQNAGGANGGYGGDRYGGNIGQYGRFGYPQGVYDRDGFVPVDPQQLAREAQRQLQELRQQYRDDREMSGQIQQLERELQNLQVGNPSGPELQARLARTILPQLETLEVQLRNELAQAEGGQVRSPATDRTPEGFSAQVQEYFRRLSRSK